MVYNLAINDFDIADLLRVYFKPISNVVERHINDKSLSIYNIDILDITSSYVTQEPCIMGYKLVEWIRYDEIYEINIEKYNSEIIKHGFKPLYYNAFVEDYTVLPKDIGNIINYYACPKKLYFTFKASGIYNRWVTDLELCCLKNIKLGFPKEIDLTTSKKHISKVLKIKKDTHGLNKNEEEILTNLYNVKNTNCLIL